MAIGDFIQSEITKFEGLAHEVASEVGVIAHSWAAQVAHDVEVAGGDLASLMAGDLAQVWQVVKAAVIDQLKQGKGFSGAIDGAVTALKDFNWASFAPALVSVGEMTLKTMATQAASLAIAGMLAML